MKGGGLGAPGQSFPSAGPDGGATALSELALRSGARQPKVVRARRLFCQVAVQRCGYTGASEARFLGVATSAVNRLAASEELPEVKKYLKAL